MVGNLSANDFPAFFDAVHGVTPFPWQSKLARQVIEEGKWPSLLDLPTGAGKTAAIDIAVFHLAYEAEQGPARKAPLRILFVIDRRIVVDAAFDRAKKVASALKRANGNILKIVADRLRYFTGNENNVPVLQATRLRGGMPQERDWARSPAQPLVVVSTVDQIGSRLLFRGYGVSRRMWPVHAGLVGSDTLWLLDEVHLSKPLGETLRTIETGHRLPPSGPIMAEKQRLAPFVVTRLSATPDEIPDQPFRLSGEDRAHSELRLRLAACKLAEVGTWNDGKAAETFCKTALQFIEGKTTSKTRKRKKKHLAEISPPVSRVAVVVNHVGLAREIFEKLQKEAGEKVETVLLTGRIRSLDRDRLMEKVKPFLAAPNRSEPEHPIILVATQTVEAGADLDFDALVTEIAPLDSLRQRFGRLDRLGKRGNSHAVILQPSGKKPKKGDRNDWTPIFRLYGDTAHETGKWLGEPGTVVDFGIDAFAPKLQEAANDQKIEKLLAPRTRAPVLLPSYVEMWATTSPPPTATPEPALFLHGPKNQPDVQIVWRADIDPSREDEATRTLQYCPPSSLEAVSVPIWAARRWLQLVEKDADVVADVPEAEIEVREQTAEGRLCLRRNDDASWSKTLARNLRPSDTIVVPCVYGGCDRWGWNPRARDKVADLGAEAHYRQRARGAVRVTHETLKNALDQDDVTDSAETWRDIQGLIEESGGAADAETMLASLEIIGGLPNTWRVLLQAMKGRSVEVEFYDDDDHTHGFVLYAKRALDEDVLKQLGAEETKDDSGNDAVTEQEDSWATGVRVGLIQHLGHVEEKSRHFAERAGLDEDKTNLLALAGKMHDLGKTDPRFQADLYGTSALLAQSGLLSPLLAKSVRGGGRTRSQRAAPTNFRHEALSVAFARQYPAVAELNEEDRDLVLWLVGTHHGYGRPFFPPCEDSEADVTSEADICVEMDGQTLKVKACDAPLRLDQGWFERATRLVRRYGPWELARLEAILRLADHAASAAEQPN